MAKKGKPFELPDKLIDELDEIMEIEENGDHPIHEKFVKAEEKPLFSGHRKSKGFSREKKIRK